MIPCRPIGSFEKLHAWYGLVFTNTIQFARASKSVGRSLSDFAIHLTAEIFGEADALLSMTALRAAAEGGRTQISLRNLRKLDCVAIIDESDPLAMLAAKR